MKEIDPSQPTSNGDVVRRLYDAFAEGDGAKALANLHETIEWNEAENFVYADRNPYKSPAAAAEGVFGRLVADWESYEATPSEILEACNDTVIALGRSRGVNRATRKLMDAQFAHIWRLKEGKIVGFQQYIDTLQVHRAMQGNKP